MQPLAYFQQYWGSSAGVMELIESLRASLVESKTGGTKATPKSVLSGHIGPALIKRGFEDGSLLKVIAYEP